MIHPTDRRFAGPHPGPVYTAARGAAGRCRGHRPPSRAAGSCSTTWSRRLPRGGAVRLSPWSCCTTPPMPGMMRMHLMQSRQPDRHLARAGPDPASIRPAASSGKRSSPLVIDDYQLEDRFPLMTPIWQQHGISSGLLPAAVPRPERRAGHASSLLAVHRSAYRSGDLAFLCKVGPPRWPWPSIRAPVRAGDVSRLCKDSWKRSATGSGCCWKSPNAVVGQSRSARGDPGHGRQPASAWWPWDYTTLVFCSRTAGKRFAGPHAWYFPRERGSCRRKHPFPLAEAPGWPGDGPTPAGCPGRGPDLEADGHSHGPGAACGGDPLDVLCTADGPEAACWGTPQRRRPQTRRRPLPRGGGGAFRPGGPAGGGWPWRKRAGLSPDRRIEGAGWLAREKHYLEDEIRQETRLQRRIVVRECGPGGSLAQGPAIVAPTSFDGADRWRDGHWQGGDASPRGDSPGSVVATSAPSSKPETVRPHPDRAAGERGFFGTRKRAPSQVRWPGK